MGLAIALVVVLITLLSGYFFLAKTWWFPVDITANYGHAIDHQFMLTLAITGTIFVVANWRWPMLSGVIATVETGEKRGILTAITSSNLPGPLLPPLFSLD